MPERERHAQPQLAARFVAAAIEIGFRRFEFRQRAHAAVVVRLAVVGQALAARRALQQSRTEPFLEPRDRLADRRARHVEPFRGKREAAGFHYLDEGRDAVESVGHGGLR